MKLLFDQNLSPRLPSLLADLYPHSAHIRDLGMRDATDTVIWEYAALRLGAPLQSCGHLRALEAK